MMHVAHAVLFRYTSSLLSSGAQVVSSLSTLLVTSVYRPLSSMVKFMVLWAIRSNIVS